MIENGTLVIENGSLVAENGTLVPGKGTVEAKIGTVVVDNGTLAAEIGTLAAESGTLAAKSGTLAAEIGPLAGKSPGSLRATPALVAFGSAHGARRSLASGARSERAHVMPARSLREPRVARLAPCAVRCAAPLWGGRW